MKKALISSIIAIVIVAIATSAITTITLNKNFAIERNALEEELRIANDFNKEASSSKEADIFSPYIDLVYMPNVEKNSSEDKIDTSNFNVSKLNSDLPGISVNAEIDRIELLEGKFNDEEVDQTILKIYLDENSEDFRVTFSNGKNIALGNLQESTLFADNLKLSFRGFLSDNSLTINGLPENVSTFTVKTREATPGYTIESLGELHTVETIQFVFP